MSLGVYSFKKDIADGRWSDLVVNCMVERRSDKNEREMRQYYKIPNVQVSNDLSTSVHFEA
jgi:hypothetical protein